MALLRIVRPFKGSIKALFAQVNDYAEGLLADTFDLLDEVCVNYASIEP
jgi:hypothetical protein